MWRLLGGVALAFVACVDNGDVGDAAAQGTLGGSCFPNNTCNGALVCALVNGVGVCEQGDAATDATFDQSNDTSTSDVTNDVSDTGIVDAAGDACSTTLAPSHACANVCAGSSTPLCCEMLGQCVSTAAQCANGGAWACQSRTDCSGTEYCCATSVSLVPHCPLSGQMTSSSQATCQNSCGSGTFALCLVPSDCPSTTPNCVGVQFSGVSVSLGVCQ
jgi:hypothetical protein